MSAADTPPATIAAALITELIELFGITDTAITAAIEALAAVLADAHVFDDLSPGGRIVGPSGYKAYCGQHV